MSAPLALVTGGTRGIGRAIASALSGAGYEVIAAARTAPAEPQIGRASWRERVYI